MSEIQSPAWIQQEEAQRASWPEDLRSRKNIRHQMRRIEEASAVHSAKGSKSLRWQRVAPSLAPAKHPFTRRAGIWSTKQGQYSAGIERQKGNWTYSGIDTWRGKPDRWGRVPDVLKSLRPESEEWCAKQRHLSEKDSKPK